MVFVPMAKARPKAGAKELLYEFDRCSNEGEGQVCCVQRANMWQDCSLTAVQRNAAFVEQS